MSSPSSIGCFLCSEPFFFFLAFLFAYLFIYLLFGWPPTYGNLLASASQVLELQACTTNTWPKLTCKTRTNPLVSGRDVQKRKWVWKQFSGLKTFLSCFSGGSLVWPLFNRFVSSTACFWSHNRTMPGRGARGVLPESSVHQGLHLWVLEGRRGLWQTSVPEQVCEDLSPGW